jgi:hypothetical protein
MAQSAIRSALISPSPGLAMHAPGVIARHLRVALRALRLGNPSRMGEVLVPRMATRTVHRGVGAALDLLALFVTGGASNPLLRQGETCEAASGKNQKQ